jgi:phosphoglycolate phosphatase-like HAD superfamily hydrolase
MGMPLIALDADGVLLDYSLAYARAWERAFATALVERDPTAYWPIQRWGVPRLSGNALEQFRACFEETFWTTVPAIDGARAACQALHDAGYRLVCVSALEPRFERARLRNLRDLDFPIGSWPRAIPRRPAARRRPLSGR